MLTKKKLIRAAVFITLCLTLLVAGWIGWAWVHRSRLSINQSSSIQPHSPIQYILHSRRPDGAVVIPFDLEGGAIFLKIKVGSKVVVAQLDTGSSAILWPADLHLGPIQGTVRGSFTDVGGQGVQSDVSILKDMQIGDLELKNITSYALKYPKGVETQGPRQRRIMILGDAAFAGCVLTIDYVKSKLILHPAGYPPPETAKCYGCFWTNVDPLTHAGNPTILGSFEGDKASIELDTGWDNGTVGLSTSMYHQVLPRLRHSQVISTTETYDSIFGRSSSTLISNCHFSVFGTNGTATADVVASLPNKVDIVLCPYDLSNYRVTIDYSGKRVWQELKTQSAQSRASRIGLWFRFTVYGLIGLLAGALWIVLIWRVINPNRWFARVNLAGWISLTLFINASVHAFKGNIKTEDLDNAWQEPARFFLFFMIGSIVGAWITRRRYRKRRSRAEETIS